MTYQHAELAAGRWHKMSLAEQLGNIGSEVSRARRAEGKQEERFKAATDRALELFDLTLSDVRWRGGPPRGGRAPRPFFFVVGGGEGKGTTTARLRATL